MQGRITKLYIAGCQINNFFGLKSFGGNNQFSRAFSLVFSLKSELFGGNNQFSRESRFIFGLKD